LGLELGRTRGLDTSDAYRELGLPQDPRTYDRVVFVLNHFGIGSVRLLTNNPRKMEGLARGGIEVVREPLQIPPTDHSRPYLETKATKMGHMLDFTHSVSTSDAECEGRGFVAVEGSAGGHPRADQGDQTPRPED